MSLIRLAAIDASAGFVMGSFCVDDRWPDDASICIAAHHIMRECDSSRGWAIEEWIPCGQLAINATLHLYNVDMDCVIDDGTDGDTIARVCDPSRYVGSVRHDPLKEDNEWKLW